MDLSFFSMWTQIFSVSAPDRSFQVVLRHVIGRWGFDFVVNLSPPLSALLNKSVYGYRLKSGTAINHLLYIDDIKLYAKNERDINSLTHLTRVLSSNISMPFGLNNAGLVTFYITNVRSVLTYASLAWFSLLSDFGKNEIKMVQRSATRIVLPHCSYKERLKSLELPFLYDLTAYLSKTQFIKVLHNSRHPLF